MSERDEEEKFNHRKASTLIRRVLLKSVIRMYLEIVMQSNQALLCYGRLRLTDTYINLVCDQICARKVDSFSWAAASTAGSCSYTQWIISSCSDKRSWRALIQPRRVTSHKSMGGRLFFMATSSVCTCMKAHIAIDFRWTQFLTDAFHLHSRFQTFEVWQWQWRI